MGVKIQDICEKVINAPQLTILTIILNKKSIWLKFILFFLLIENSTELR